MSCSGVLGVLLHLLYPIFLWSSGLLWDGLRHLAGIGVRYGLCSHALVCWYVAPGLSFSSSLEKPHELEE